MAKGKNKTTRPQEEAEALRARVAELEQLHARQRHADSTLRESEQLHRNLVETSPDSIVLTDLAGSVLMANHQAAVMHGYDDPKGMLGLNVLELVAPEERERAGQDINTIVEKGGLRNQLYTLLHRDGSRFTAEVSGSRITDAQGRPKSIIYNGRDITERNRLQQQVLQSQKLESIGRLAGGVAHDFNNLLAVILGNASMQVRNETLPPKAREALMEIMRAAERASALTTQLLAYARGGSQQPAPADLNRLVKSVWDMLHRTAPPRIELALNLGGDLPLIMADASQIEQVVMNLCLNAVQASRVPSRIEISTIETVLEAQQAAELELRPGLYVRLRVADQGCGMDAQTAERVFEPFFTTKAENRGLGLSITLGIVQSHHGQIRLASEPGKGTQIDVWLPAAPAQVQPPPSPPKPASPPHGSETILIIEDKAMVAQTAEQLLSSVGYCALAQTDADQALKCLRTNHEDMDLVILDLNMPKHSAREMLEAIKQDAPGMPVLLTSGFEPGDLETMCAEPPVVGFLQKPFNLTSLAEAVRKALDSYSPPGHRK